MKIIFIRHGETDWNKQCKVQGVTDIPLNQHGIETSTRQGHKLNAFNIVAAYSSQLSRAYQTGCLMLAHSKHKHLTIQQDVRIMERSFGQLEGYYFQDYYASLKTELGKTIETEQQVHKRIKEFLLECYQQHKHETIVVVSHGGCIKHFLQFENLIPSKDILFSDDQYKKYRHIPNNSIHELEYNGTHFTLLNFNL